MNPDGYERLLAKIDATDGLRDAMDFEVVYSLADRPCQRCLEGRVEPPGEAVALVKTHHAAHPKGHLVTLCAAHASRWEQQNKL